MPTTDPSSFVTDADLLAAYPVFADDAWKVTVTSSADDTYTVTAGGTPFPHGPTVGESILNIRDGLLAAMAPTIQGLFETAADGTNAILMVSTVDNFPLDVSTDPATLFATVQSGVSPADRQCALDLTKCLICDTTWGCNTWRGHLSATVHYLKLWGRSRETSGTGPTGQTTSMGQGPYSQSWGVVMAANTSEAWWSMTPEGQQYLAIRNSLGTFARGMVMGMGCQR